ncbi:hypothetical protein BOS5A_150003 [Bosea sp. EC-HK365B]|nr:hypothetical protein BOSE46_100033 [Bosea sp. 46]CAD5257038.1 hypothetical protein BOSE21B_110035 [Bosea sp. 21B]CAD5284020.1 hypothetical protein BOSE7B_41181 [Bosea sp. 7B]VVT56393.1 hypothetical protein BOS5A_150003 [Bosea sp. EC-HK365B]VXB34287.1 hypothetical protein BOSE29B_100144 [Bosea sp. 29B]VXB77862.1 hypothetical protein BOSE125_150147 [Bosea sp. 125]VXC90680.1 hypothetical protein BOSE127_70225 [Bosea sp. 127]
MAGPSASRGTIIYGQSVGVGGSDRSIRLISTLQISTQGGFLNVQAVELRIEPPMRKDSVYQMYGHFRLPAVTIR